MNHTFKQLPSYLTIFLLILACPCPLWAAEKSVGVLLSREIGPYVAMVEGLESELKRPVQRFFLDKTGSAYSLSGQSTKLEPLSHDVLVAVGPEALRFFNSYPEKSRLVYGMVLNPENVTEDSTNLPCGVSLNIPVESQIKSILQYLPSLKRLGVLFDPKNNQSWFDEAKIISESLGVELIPIQVNRQGGKMEISSDFTRLDALLFIPDKSIISKAVIQYVIKQGVLHLTPVIGYNRFFYNSGAALSFLVDYKAVGQQVARQVQRLLAGMRCEDLFSPYDVLINRDVWRSLHLYTIDAIDTRDTRDTEPEISKEGNDVKTLPAIQ